MLVQELLLLVLPLLNMMSIRKVLMLPFSNGSPLSSLPEDACAICEAQPITTPYMALPCGHLYCYYCLRTRSLADRNLKCLRCSVNIVALKRHQVEVSIESVENEEKSQWGCSPYFHWFHLIIFSPESAFEYFLTHLLIWYSVITFQTFWGNEKMIWDRIGNGCKWQTINDKLEIFGSQDSEEDWGWGLPLICCE